MSATKPDHDPPHGSLAEALAAFQAEGPKVTKDSVNPHFRSKFASLDSIVDTVTPLLAKHGLAWSALPCFGPNGEPALRYQLVHISGDVISDVMPLLVQKSDPQGMGSALTYARRYSLTAVLNLVADEDDDGNAATPRNGAQRAQPTAAPAQQTQRLANAGQRGKINAKAAEAKLSASVLATIVLVSTGNSPREWASEDAARNFLQRALDRLPANKVDAVLENIKAETVTT